VAQKHSLEFTVFSGLQVSLESNTHLQLRLFSDGVARNRNYNVVIREYCFESFVWICNYPSNNGPVLIVVVQLHVLDLVGELQHGLTFGWVL